MTDAGMLETLKQNLELLTSARDGYLTGLIARARAFIVREGITLTDSVEDSGLVVMYAAYLYRKRKGDEAGMPRMLRWALNNRLMSEKAGVTNDA